jgi:polyvinyl alcohol dehydrogenase (cytochrome)
VKFASRLVLIVTTILLSSGAYSSEDGKAVYDKQCASCHDNAAGRTPTKKMLNELSANAIVTSLQTGVMRVIGQWNMDGSQRVAVAEYLSGEKYDAAWAADDSNSCASSALVSSDPFEKPHWNGWGNGDENARFQGADMAGLSKADVANLELDWVFAFPGETNVESQPTVVDNRIYMGSKSGLLYMLDARSGCTYWTFQAGSSIKNSVLIKQVGDDDRLMAFFGDISGWIYSLDAITGELIWKIRGDSHPAARIVGGIQHHEGALYVGMTSLEEGLAIDPNYSCCSFRGTILKVDAATGRTIWQTYTIDETPIARGKNNRGNLIVGPSGATVWSAVTLDTKLNRLYAATSDNYSQPATGTSDSIVALSMSTGKIEWVYQGLVGDAWNAACQNGSGENCPDDAGPDEDMGSSPMLMTLPSGKRILAAGQKTGVLHVMDPDNNGKLLWQKKLAEGGILGGIEWGPANDGDQIYVAAADATWREQRFLSADTELNPDTGGGMFAIDPESGEVNWEAPPGSCAGRIGSPNKCSPAQNAGVTVIPGVVFSGALSGILKAYDTENGQIVWEYDTVRDFSSVNGAKARGGALDGPGTVVVDGTVYVTSGYAKFGAHGGNVLLAFKPKNRLTMND